MRELTQNQIAKLSRVSQATVSRVLRGDPRVNEELRQRVLAVIEQHGYVPDARAQSLRSQRTGILGLVVHRSPKQLARDPFFSALIAAIIEFAGKAGYHLCVDAARAVQSRRAIYEELLRTRRVDGLILVEPQTQDERMPRLLEEGFPFVLIGRYELAEAVYSVDNDNIGAGRMATEYLLHRGHRRIAYISGPRGLFVCEDRYVGYQQALREAGGCCPPELVVWGDFTEEHGYRAMSRLLSLPKPPTAVVAVDDLVAIGALRAARERGAAVPGHLAVVGFNDSPFCQYVEPPLSSVAVDIRALAQIATDLLVRQVEGRAPTQRRYIVPCHLVERNSA
ncbi:MAG: LacI family DNA-binding transcriptional regulator [Armatimonadota bacterium]|nr:LacI family DNA-binding transcriptional regulator [Armatimonadota bacterium]